MDFIKRSKEEDTLFELINNLIKNNYILVDVEYNNADEYVTVFVESLKENSIDNISSVNGIIYEHLEKVDFLKNNFSLEISSPGLFRKIRHKYELDIFKNRNIKITLIDKSVLTGINNGINGDDIAISVDGEIKNINLNSIKSVHLNG